MNADFLRELAENINLSFRSHAETDKETLVRLLTKKIRSEKAETILKMYLTCFDAKDVAKAIKPKGMEEIILATEQLFRASNCLYEVTVGARRCDLVLFVDDEIIAIEAKSAQDQMKSATSQLSYYGIWANKVFLAYDSKHARTVDKLGLAEKGIGLLEFNRGNIKMTRDAIFQEKNPESYLSLMTYRHLRKVARTFNVVSEGTKQDITKRLILKLSISDPKAIFREFLKARSLR